jgi:FG-GAP repeat
LFDLNGQLLVTFTNNPSASWEYFGVSVAAVGVDRVLIGAFGFSGGAMLAGAAYLFDLDGSLLTCFTNPTPAAFEQFGYAVAAAGTDKVIIGAPLDSTGNGSGAAYLFSTAGALLTTFTNPVPTPNGQFGFAISMVDADRVLIGARGNNTGDSRSGAAFLFDLNGRLLNVFAPSNSIRGYEFGFSLVTGGNDTIYIGEPGNFWSPSPGPGRVNRLCIPNQSSSLFNCFIAVTNPAPIASSWFGSSMAALRNDRVIIGAPLNAVNAYLLDANGVPLVTFTNPVPMASDGFGSSLAAVSLDKIVIGAPNVERAYLFNESGSFLTTFTNSIPGSARSFGTSVAAAGADKVVIGAPDVSTAYVFDLTGTPTSTITNPVRSFGFSLAALNSDKIIIGGNGGAFLYDVDGALLTTFTNPYPAQSVYFGSSVTGVGADKVIVADSYGPNTVYAGQAYLFDVQGRILTTYTNPAPNVDDFFGACVIAVGSDKVLIGAPGDDSGAIDSGAAYLFDLEGTLLATFYNPWPSAGDSFGSALVALDANRILVGARGDSAISTNAGTAYVFCLPEPQLEIARSSGAAIVRWKGSRLFSGYRLECSTNLTDTGNVTWSEVPLPYQTNATHISVTVPFFGRSSYYRLRKP